MSEWISVKDRRPNARGEGILNNESLRVLCSVRSEISGGSRLEVGTYSTYSREWTEFEHGEYRGTSAVTHWMPLPAPPTE